MISTALKSCLPDREQLILDAERVTGENFETSVFKLKNGCVNKSVIHSTVAPFFIHEQLATNQAFSMPLFSIKATTSASPVLVFKLVITNGFNP